MKRIVFFILALLMVFSLFSCNQSLEKEYHNQLVETILQKEYDSPEQQALKEVLSVCVGLFSELGFKKFKTDFENQNMIVSVSVSLDTTDGPYDYTEFDATFCIFKKDPESGSWMMNHYSLQLMNRENHYYTGAYESNTGNPTIASRPDLIEYKALHNNSKDFYMMLPQKVEFVQLGPDCGHSSFWDEECANWGFEDILKSLSETAGYNSWHLIPKEDWGYRKAGKEWYHYYFHDLIL